MSDLLALVMTVQTIGSLKVRVVEAKAAVKPARVVVLLHGYGAPGDDLVSLARELQLTDTKFIFPEAPIDLGEGRAWWHIDWQERARFQRTGDWQGYGKLVPPDLQAARHAVDELLDVLEKDVGADHLVLGGFSQGAMLALDVVAQRARKPKQLVMMSGSIIAQGRWLPHLQSLKGLPVFISHGYSDEVLPFAIAEKLRDMLGAAGALVAWLPFHGGHAIPRDVLTALAAFLH